ncbi:uncharacterized protein LOC117304125 [Asterias rubens]|uniref:uncharacterized protein LOC117304125 n=1 Tax=Asterias rubens TaxID=7604 RepID=UPI001454F171|nr:uncharacterized protein LOC117304125 [Asterias rubens]
MAGRLTLSPGESLRHMETPTSKLQQQAFVVDRRRRRRRETSKLQLFNHDTKPSLQQKNCDDKQQRQAPANPTVVAGIVGGALAFFLVVVLTIIYCSYKNHAPSDLRKRVADLYTYIGDVEDVIWMPGANPAAVDIGTCEHVKFDGISRLAKYPRQA